MNLAAGEHERRETAGHERRRPLQAGVLAASVGLACCVTATASAQVATPVTTQRLEQPSPDDWLSFSRTPNAQRFSPLAQINRENVGDLVLAWSRGMGPGALESIPIVADGVMFMLTPTVVVQAVDATNGDLLWEFQPEGIDFQSASTERSKALAIYGDVLLLAGPDSTVYGIEAATGKLRWQTKADHRAHTSAPIVADGKIITGGACGSGTRADCYISAHDALTGKLVWKFFTVQAPDDPPGFDTWGGAPLDTRLASTWGLAGSYDPQRRLIYWGVANPMPNTRLARHGGNPDAIKRSTPADLYSNSTVALDVDTGELKWYYQHLPGDDWDLDYTNERILLTTPIDPDPEAVKWINPRIPRGAARDVVVAVGEPGGLFMLDAATGEFIWATPFPYDVPNFHIGDINVETGEVFPNYELGFKAPGEHHVVCFQNTTSFWPAAYHPRTNALYVPWVDTCLDMTAGEPPARDQRREVANSASPDELAGLAKIDMETGRITHIYKGRAPGNGGVLATAGDLVFWGDLDRRFRAFDADSGEILWETVLGGAVQMSTITYAVDGEQYVAVYTGEGLLTGSLIALAGLTPPRNHNAVYVFRLPD
jgi:alcohol dehydrogenase (cytochrome c)